MTFITKDGFNNSVHRFKDGRMCDFSFIDNAENGVNKFKNDETKFRDAKKQQSFYETNLKGFRKESEEQSEIISNLNKDHNI